jgi:hypothetical protein
VRNGPLGAHDHRASLLGREPASLESQSHPRAVDSAVLRRDDEPIGELVLLALSLEGFSLAGLVVVVVVVFFAQMLIFEVGMEKALHAAVAVIDIVGLVDRLVGQREEVLADRLQS